MGTEDEINCVSHRLDALLGGFSSAFQNNDVESCEVLLRRYFRTLQKGHAHGTLLDDELSHYVILWGEAVSKLSSLCPNTAYLSASTAWDICKDNSEQSPCDKLIVNTVAVCINGLACRALYSHVNSKGMMDMSDTNSYLFASGNVLMTMAPHMQSPYLQETYYDALTKFERILFGSFVTPTERYRHVKKIRDFAELNGEATRKLLHDMDSLLEEYGDSLPNGQGIILNPLEIQADQLAKDHCTTTVYMDLPEGGQAEVSKERQRQRKTDIISFAKARAHRAGVHPHYAVLYQKIEKSLQADDYKAAAQRLFTLFHRLAADGEDINGGDLSADQSTYSYFMTAAERLSDKSLTHGFHLASRCIAAIEEEGIYLKELQESVYGFAVPVIANWEEADSNRLSHSKELNKVIMKRSSEFVDSEQVEDIFESAAIGYREYLGTIPPQQRYDELVELSAWLDGRTYPSPMMEEFVDSLMNLARDYGSFKGIPLEEDTINHLTLVPSP